MSVISHTSSWWAASSGRARLTALGAILLVGALTAASVVIWNSPANPVREVVAAATETSAHQKLEQQRDALLKQTADLKRQLADSKSGLTTTKAQLASIQQQLWSAQGQLASIQAGAAKAPAKGAKAPAKPAATAATVSAPTKAQLLTPASDYFGLYTQQAPFNFADFNAASAQIGSTPNVVGYFAGWDQPYRGDVVTASWKRNLLPVLTWESRPNSANNSQVSEPDYTLPQIIGDPAAGVAGKYDDYLRQYADAIVATGLPLGIRLDHEMNGIWYPWSEDDGHGNAINGNRPGDYVKMWQHVHDIFQQEGANSLVVWIWSPNIVNNLPAAHKTPAYLKSLYPGDQYVDLVGLSGYLRPPYKADNDFTFDYTFGASLQQLRQLTTKRILLSEVGASETGGHKPAWITSLFTALTRPENRDIIGFSWFDMAVTSYTEGELSTNDWRIEARPEDLQAFAAGLAMPGSPFSLIPD